MRKMLLFFIFVISFQSINAQFLRPQEKDGKWGFTDHRGKFLIKPQFDETGRYFGQKTDLCAVKKDGKWGFLKKDGTLQIPYQFDDTGQNFNLESGLCPVKKDGKWGYLKLDNTISIPYQYEYATGFNKGKAVVKKEKIYAAINVDGSVHFELECDSLKTLGFDGDEYLIVKDGQYGTLDSVGHIFIEPLYDDLKRGWKKSYLVKKDGKWGIMENGQANFDSPEKIVFNYNSVDKKSWFPGCDYEKLDKQHAKKCADEKMLQFIYGNIKYPAEARKNSIQGMVVVSFVVDAEGNILHPEIVRDIGGGAGEESIRVVKSMPKWVPAVLEGKPVSTSFNIPIKFKLE